MSQPTLQDVIRQAAEDKDHALAKEMIDGQIKVFSGIYDKAVAYTNVIIALGYAGFFGLWSLTKPYLTKPEALSAAAAMAISLFVFVFFEVYKMAITGFAMQRRALGVFDENSQTSAALFVKKLKDFEAANQKDAFRLAAIWPYILGLAVSFAVIGYGILVYSCIRGLWLG